MSAAIDLRPKINVHLSRVLSQWCAIDLETFDPDPDSKWHILCYADTTAGAVEDLLLQLTEARGQ